MTGRILVVDDQRANSELLAGVLQARGYQVSTAPSGEAALAARWSSTTRMRPVTGEVSSENYDASRIAA